MDYDKDYNPVAAAAYWVRDHVNSPLTASLLLGAAAFGAGRLGWESAVETVKSLGRPFMSGSARKLSAWERSMDGLAQDSAASWRIPAAAGVLTALGSMYMMGKANQPYWGLGSWDAPAGPSVDESEHPWTDRPYERPLAKHGSLDPYVQDIDWSHPVHAGIANTLMGPESGIQDDGVRLTGTAIVNDAARRQHTASPTLGAIFDSAVDKIGTRLSLGTVLSAGARAVAANQAARLFTGALGAVCDLPQPARRALVDAGTWAGALTAILN